MKKSILFAVSGLVMAGLVGGCMSPRDSRRAQTRRHADVVAVDIDVKRNEETVRSEKHRDVRRDGQRVQERRTGERGDVAAAMIRPDECPMVEGSNVSIVDLGDGAALEFIASDADQVQVVRDRVLNIAVKHQRAMQERLTATSPHSKAQAGEGRSAEVREQAQREARIDPMPASHVAVVDVDRGARIIFVPVERSDLDLLNESLEQRAAMMAEGSCPANLMSMRVPEADSAG